MTNENTSINNFIFFVGGTGQQVAYNYFNLVRLLDLEPYNFIFVDGDNQEYDEKDPSKKTITGVLLEEFPEYGVEFEKYYNPGATMGKNVNFSEFFSHDPKLSIFSENKQLNTSVSEGFFGQPMVGASVFDSKKDSFNIPKVTDAKKIAFVGSCFGGTGAGVTPVIISKYAKNAFSFYIVHGKFFSINKPDIESIQKRNNDSAFYYYFDKFSDKLNRLVVFDRPPSDADFNPLVIEGDNIKDKRQGVRYFSYDFLSAVTLIGYLNLDLNEATLTSNDPLKLLTIYFEYPPLKLRYFKVKNILNEDSILSEQNDSSIDNLEEQFKITQKAALYLAVLFYDFEHKRIGGFTDHTPKNFDKIIKSLNASEFDNLKGLISNKYNGIRKSFVSWLSQFNTIEQNKEIVTIPNISLPDLSQETSINTFVNNILINGENISAKKLLKEALKSKEIDSFEKIIKEEGNLQKFSNVVFSSIRALIEKYEKSK